MLEDRYGKTRSRRVDRTIVFVTIGLVIVGTITWALFGGWGGGSTPVEANEIGFQLSEDSATLKYEVSAPANTAVACAIESSSESFATVGWKIVELEATPRLTRHLTETVRTIREPNSIFVRQCWILENER